MSQRRAYERLGRLRGGSMSVVNVCSRRPLTVLGLQSPSISLSKIAQETAFMTLHLKLR
jgi:hypothetical protein